MTFVTKSNGKNKLSYNPNDEIMTPPRVAAKIISVLPLKPTDFLLDPFKGEGAFYNQFPANPKDWCEVKEGRDFYDWKKEIDWVISNPPYSQFTEVMKHSYKIAKNICYLIPLSKIVASWGRCLDLDAYGGVRKLWIFPAGKANFPLRLSRVCSMDSKGL